MRRKITRSLAGLALSMLLVLATTGPATAMTVVPRDYRGNHGSFNYSCSYQLSAPSTQVTTVNVVISATAAVTPRQSTNPALATAVSCWLSHGTGGVGLTAYGSTVAIAGTASFNVADGLPSVCFAAGALYLSGHSDAAPTQCVPIDESELLAIDDFSLQWDEPPLPDRHLIHNPDPAEELYWDYCVDWDYSQAQWDDACQHMDSILHPR